MFTKKCTPTTYAVIRGQNVTYGFRCARHGIATRRYSTQAIRDERLDEHVKLAWELDKKRAKKS